MYFHTKSIEASFLALKCNNSGLSKEEVQNRQEKYGLNILPSKPDKTLFAHFFQQF